jgi:carbamate kinase
MPRARRGAPIFGRPAGDIEHARSVVASPQPLRIVAIAVIRALPNAGAVVIRAGGGIPVVERAGKRYRVGAGVDKNLAATRLASVLHANVLLLLTN